MEVIYSYTRKQAIADGVLVDITASFPDLVQNAGLKIHVAMTSAAFAKCIELNPMAERMGCDLKGRAWDVLWMLVCEIRRNRSRSELLYELRCWTPEQYCNATGPALVTLKCVCGPDDVGDPCLTIMLPDED